MAPRAKYKWSEITAQYLGSDCEDFMAFCRSMGYPTWLTRTNEAKGIAEKKRRIMAEVRQKMAMALQAEPLVEREQKRQKVLKDLEATGMALRNAVTARLFADQLATRVQPGESQEDWAIRMSTQKNKGLILTPHELLSIAGAVKVSDEIVRKATGLEDFNWESEYQKNQLVTKSNRLEFEIVKTTNARPLEEVQKEIEHHKVKA